MVELGLDLKECIILKCMLSLRLIALSMGVAAL